MILNRLTINILRFVILLLIQALILNNIQLTSLGISPHLYILFILLLPFEVPPWGALLLSFFMGLLVDIFDDTLGLNTSASVLAAYFRPYILQIIAPRDGYESGTNPNISYFGFAWFLKYSGLIIFFHQFIYYLVDMFTFIDFHITILKILIGTIFTTLIILISQYFLHAKNKSAL